MLFKTQSASVYGIDAYVVEVGSAYMKDFNVVGLPDNAVKESRERIKSESNGFGVSSGQYVRQLINHSVRGLPLRSPRTLD